MVSKKIFFLLLLCVFALSSCSEGSSIEDINSSEVAESQTSSFSGEISEQTDEGSFNDFSFYTLDGKLIVSLLAREDDIDYEDADVERVLSGFDIINFNNKNPNDIYVDRLLYSRGSGQVVQTGKFIRTAGNSGGKYVVSNEADVLDAYGIDPENEEYCTLDNEAFKNITLYFFVDADGSVERRKYPKNTDISSLKLLENANVCATFGISKNTSNVMSISMEYLYKKA